MKTETDMEILIRRIYQKEECTVGCLQIVLSGAYESEFLSPSQLKAYPKGGRIGLLCDTLEPRAIAWEDKPLIGQKAGERIFGKTAIPEGRYLVRVCYSKTYKRKMPMLQDVPSFGCIVMRTGKFANQTRGDVLLGHLGRVKGGHPSDHPHLEDSRCTFNRLYDLIEEAIDHGEEVHVTVRSPKGWTYPE